MCELKVGVVPLQTDCPTEVGVGVIEREILLLNETDSKIAWRQELKPRVILSKKLFTLLSWSWETD